MDYIKIFKEGKFKDMGVEEKISKVLNKRMKKNPELWNKITKKLDENKELLDDELIFDIMLILIYEKFEEKYILKRIEDLLVLTKIEKETKPMVIQWEIS